MRRGSGRQPAYVRIDGVLLGELGHLHRLRMVRDHHLHERDVGVTGLLGDRLIRCTGAGLLAGAARLDDGQVARARALLGRRALVRSSPTARREQQENNQHREKSESSQRPSLYFHGSFKVRRLHTSCIGCSREGPCHVFDPCGDPATTPRVARRPRPHPHRAAGDLLGPRRPRPRRDRLREGLPTGPGQEARPRGRQLRQRLRPRRRQPGQARRQRRRTAPGSDRQQQEHGAGRQHPQAGPVPARELPQQRPGVQGQVRLRRQLQRLHGLRHPQADPAEGRHPGALPRLPERRVGCATC